MRNYILSIVLILALLIGVGSVIFYNVQDYEFNLNIQDNILASEIFVTLNSGQIWNGTTYETREENRNIESISLNLGKMTFTNQGVLSRVVEIPRYVACFDLTSTQANTLNTGASYNFIIWPVYTNYEPVFNSNSGVGIPQVYGSDSVAEIYPQNQYIRGYYNRPVEVKVGSELVYYISIKNFYISIQGEDSSVFKNGKIIIYELPMKEYNPISPEVTYDTLIYNPTCDVLAQEFEPVETIRII